jgi:hypothetical protein
MNKSRISLKMILRQDVPSFVIDFFTKGLHHEELPSVLYDYGFTFDNKPNLLTGTYLLCQLVETKNEDAENICIYHLCIEHQFDFDDEIEAPKGYWFVGGLAQYAEDQRMAGYITHQDGNTQLFGFKDQLNFFVNDITMDFDGARRTTHVNWAMAMEKHLFNLKLFSHDFAVFPKMVFNKVFDHHYFMRFNDWFHDPEDYRMLQIFLTAINEPVLYCSVPAFYDCPDVAINLAKGYQHFIDKYTFMDRPEHPYYGIGLRNSPTGFWYGANADWAMVSDLINNIIIVGLDRDAALNFRVDFAEKYFDINQQVANMEQGNFELGKIVEGEQAAFSRLVDREEIIKIYR